MYGKYLTYTSFRIRLFSASIGQVPYWGAVALPHFGNFVLLHISKVVWNHRKVQSNGHLCLHYFYFFICL